VEAQVDKGEKSLREYASQLRAQADASEGVLRQEIARLRSEAAVSLSAASPNSSRPPTVAELGLRVEALKQLKETGVTRLMRGENDEDQDDADENEGEEDREDADEEEGEEEEAE
jgi:hypothetical protein